MSSDDITNEDKFRVGSQYIFGSSYSSLKSSSTSFQSLSMLVHSRQLSRGKETPTNVKGEGEVTCTFIMEKIRSDDICKEEAEVPQGNDHHIFGSPSSFGFCVDSRHTSSSTSCNIIFGEKSFSTCEKINFNILSNTLKREKNESMKALISVMKFLIYVRKTK
jgi:hypothetical protein